MRWLGFLSLAVALTRAGSPPLTISLESSWSAPPLVLEILETLYDEKPSAYHYFLSLLATHIPPSRQITPEEVLSVSLDLIRSHDILETDSAISTLNLGLSLHTSVPRIEAAYSWYETSVSEVHLGVVGCGTWVEWKGKGFCEVDGLRRDIELAIEEGTHHEKQPSRISLPFDRPSSPNPTDNSAILYLDHASSSTIPLLNYLGFHSKQYPSFSYVVRYKPSVKDRGTSRPTTPLSGYGVELALKKTDYLVVDDRVRTQGHDATQGGNDNETVVGIFTDTVGPDPWLESASPLTAAEIKDIGLKAASLIMSSSDRVAALTELSQDFPKYSAAIARKVAVDSSITDHVQSSHQAALPNTLYLNGKALNADLNGFSLLKVIREERELVTSLTSLGLSPKQAFELISDAIIGDSQTEDDAGEGVVDASDRQEDGGVITWWNDIEKDKRYSQWPRNVQAYLRPLYPGQLHTVRRNTWNLVFVLDLSSTFSLDQIANSMSTMIQRGLPIRFGVVPMISEDDELSTTMAKLFFYCVKTFGRSQTRDLLTQIVTDTPVIASGTAKIDLNIVQKAYEGVAGRSSKSSLAFAELLEVDFAEDIDKNALYTRRLLATNEDSTSGHLFVNGKHFPMSGQWMQFVQQELTSQLQFLQEQLASGITYEDTSSIFYDLPSTTIRRSKYLLPGVTDNKLKVFNTLKVFEGDWSGKLSKDFVYNPTTSRGAPITIWIIGDLDTEDSRVLIDDALNHIQRETAASRIGFVHRPDATRTSQASSTMRVSLVLYQLFMQSSLHTIHPADLQNLLRELDSVASNLDEDGKILGEGLQKVFDGTPLHAFTASGWGIKDAEAAKEYWEDIGTSIGSQLGLKSTMPHLLVNGRLIGPIKPDTFYVEDFDVLEVYELRKRVKPVIDLLKTMYDDISVFDRPTLAHLIGSASSVVASAYAPADSEGIFTPTPVARNRFYERLDPSGVMSFSVGAAEDAALLHVAVVVDPISEQAQKWSDILNILQQMDNVAITVYLRPQPYMSEVALKRFYRSALSPRLRFDVDGVEIPAEISFVDLPSTPIFTLAMDTPSSWVVRPQSSPHDLDNLVLGQIRSPVHVSFNLQQLLIEGHARESSNAPPRGLQLQLIKNDDVVSDTQVMANLGYFQFKATPGVYDLAIRPGRGTEVYELNSVGSDGWDSLNVNVTGTKVALTSFEGVTILPKFGRKHGMENENVMMEDAKPSVMSLSAESILARMKTMVGLSTVVKSVTPTRHADINIFTVASGLLYERFASIMILSVMKNTKSSVKFWFIENFLSPTFLEFIPKMAEEYGFQYEFVTYKWPHWLRAQTEKQRIIWAYKILFLDVLFPMDLDKVIFVDADQIVRTDMKELVDLDLKGHVYGYTPMGDDRKEMEGFRFWKTGYWKDALRGRPYHISALYVVDLKRFRQLATGDRLRGQYHALSADPNSLANLDQDLPNSMQDQIPIFTLPQDWLWCQTWCSDESLATAKTIDLCQNPLTKEPKLVRARQIPEWDVYDQEIARFAEKVTGDTGLAINVDDLASGKPIAEGVGEDHAAESKKISDEL